jgi:3-hydroxypropanoate dehydrogenase
MSNSNKILSDKDLDILFREARTYNHWKEQDVSDVVLQGVFDLLKMAPTSANCSPARFKFVKSEAAKEKLKPHLMGGNVDKTMTASVTVIIANDMEFYEHLPKLFPHADAKSWFAGKPKSILETATRNGTLQGAYLMMAARALGLDCGPMSGFDGDGVKDAFFKDDNVQVNFLCNLGYGDPKDMFPRSPRFDFDDICEIV